MNKEKTTRTPVRPDIIGETLNYILTTKDPYKEYTNIDQDQPGNANKVFSAIKDVFSQYLKTSLLDNAKDKSWSEESTTRPRQGDIIVLKGRNPEPKYVITFANQGNFTTWPRLTTKDSFLLKGAGVKSYNIIRPELDDISNSALEEIQNIAKEAVQDDPNLISRLKGDTLTINVAKDVENLSEGYLQIGDVGFLVDPTQIAFMTQNGYQFFPTLRTVGNPKIPTIDQIKNISISLIFPNEDSINYQLMNLVAMFKRTPFVNVRNKDICNFFKEITLGGKFWPNQWLSVALESLHIQSLEGFPNTLQAQINLLPFDSRQITPGFQALRSMRDVAIQQALLYNTQEINNIIRDSESKFDEQSVISSKFLDVVYQSVDKSYDFRESIPFRSFYQSVIADRKSITDEYGAPVQVSDISFDQDKEYPIAKFRPQRPENLLHHYGSDANNEKISFIYRYVPGEAHEVSKLLARERENEQDKLIDRLTQIKDNLATPADLLREVVTSFHTIDDAFSELSHRFKHANKIVPSLLSDAGITLDSEAQGEDFKPIEGLFSLIFRGALQRLGIEQSWNFIKDGREVVQGAFDKDAVDYLGLLNNLVYYGTDRGLDNEGSVTTAQGFIKQISDWLNVDNGKLSEERKGKFAIFLTSIRRELLAEYSFLEEDNQKKLSLFYDASGGSASPFRVARLPIEERTIEIDNIKDVITSFSILFSNKFVPISLQAFKYPYYQHMGFEDAVVSLSIKSTEESELRNELSLLSERLYQSNKILMLHAPELINFMDGRLHIDTPIKHMFRAFGVRRVVFNNSNTSSDPNNPGCWNTTMALSQANFTLEQYHKIESVPTNNTIKQELAKLLARIQIVKRTDDDRGQLVVMSYKQKKVTDSPVSLNKDPSNDKNPRSSSEISLLEDVTDMDVIVRLRFLFSRHGETLVKYINRLNESKRQQAKRRYDRKVKMEKALHNFATTHSASATGDGLDPYVPPVYQDPLPAGEDLTKDIDYLTSITTKYEQEVREVLDKSLLITRDDRATNSLNELLVKYPLFDNILRFVIQRFDTVLERETRALTNLFQLDSSFTEIFFGLDRDLVNSNNIPSGAGTTGAAALSALAFSKGGFLGNLAGGIGLALTIFQVADAAVQSTSERARTELVDRFDGFFLGILDDFNTGLLHHLGSQIYRDPIIRNKFIEAGVITPSSLDVLRDAESKLVVNCYNDFDIPPLPGEGYSLSPDFYLYNDQLDRTEVETYVRESVRRHARIGKLTALMTLQEHMDVVNQFDQVIAQMSTIDEPVAKSITSVLFDGETASTIPDIKKVSETKRKELEATFTQISRATKDFKDGQLTDSQYEQAINLYKEVHPQNPQETIETYEKRFEEFKRTLSFSKGNANINERKLNLIYSARISTLFKIFERYVGLNLYMEKKIGQEVGLLASAGNVIGRSENVNDKNPQSNSKTPDYLSKKGSDLVAAAELYSHLVMVLQDAETLTTEEFSKDKYAGVRKKLINGVPTTDNENYLSLPAIRNIQIGLYNDIGFYIRLNTYLSTHLQKEVPVTFDSLPELKFLEFWNFRERDALQRRNELTKEFLDSYKAGRQTSIKLFPTFKIFFIEEDTGVWRSNDDYYSHNAIQSLEIVSSKSSAGKTAVIRLSNVTNTLTNKQTFHREAEDALLLNNGNAADAFFGTLDVKPGTAIMIKMGYAPNDRYLDTLFVGRIIEMNTGPVVEMVCQSYGAQLNHHIVSEHFGLLATRVRELGDVASALLDTIPGLEKLGKIPLFGLLTGDFSGKNLRNIRGRAGDRFLLGNLLGSVSALSFAQDNPRDENIYLPFSLVPEALHRPTFDWTVYDQSVWDSLNELSLYTRNTCPIVRLYNNDPLSFNNDVRETIVLGDKAGYYKYTDALSLSSMNIREIDRAREMWGKLKSKVSELNERQTFFKEAFDKAKEAGWNENAQAEFIDKATQVTGNKVNATREQINAKLFRVENPDQNFGDLFLETQYQDLWLFFQNRTNALLLVANVLDKIDLTQKTELNISSYIQQLFGSADIFNQHDGLADFVNGLMEFSSSANLESNQLSSKVMGYKFIGTQEGSNEERLVLIDSSAQNFSRAIFGLLKLDSKFGGTSVLDISEDSFYNIRSQVTNRDEELVGDRRYRKIQSHHLITDIKDIISNNIALNSEFANAVNVFYTGEPTIKNARFSDVRQAVASHDINIWEVKAFGNIKDEHIRILNSYQKNIDTNWWDISSTINRFFKGYSRIKLEAGEFKNTDKLKDLLGYSYDKAGNKISPSKEIDVPRWDLFPSFVVVGVSLLQKEVEKMYQGTIEIVGNPKINPYDIIHLQDYTNDMHGAIEVEEVVHSFTPDGGFRTVITPNLITYDRDPMQLQDVDIINNISEFANERAKQDVVLGGLALVGIGVGAIGGALTAGGAAITLGPIAFNSLIGGISRHHRFLYDQLGNILGRDCINFTALIYHGTPFMAGFDGVDYTDLKTLINQKIEGIDDPVARFAAFADPMSAYISTNGSPENIKIFRSLQNYYAPWSKGLGGYPSNNRLGKYWSLL